MKIFKDSFSHTPTLPELSFDDLLDESPIKKFPARTLSDDPDDGISLKDQTLNTPSAKRKISPQTSSSTADVQAGKELFGDISAESDISTKNSVLTFTTTPSTKPVLKTTTLSTTSVSGKAVATAPIVLNNKLSFSQSGSNVPQNIVKISTTSTGKIGGTTAITSPTATATTSVKPQTMGTMTIVGGKTAIKTANGQIVYIQKAPTVAAGNSTSVNTSAPTPTFRLATLGTNSSVAIAKSNNEATPNSSAGVGNKTLAIQFVRSSDGKLVPLKSPTTAIKNALTLSPTVPAQVAVKKLLTTSNQVVFKAGTPATTVKSASAASNAPANSGSNLGASTAKPFKIQKIMAPSASALAKNATTTILNAPSISKPIAASVSSSTTLLNSTSTTTSCTFSKPLLQTSTSSTAGGKIFVQGTNGKQIVVSNSQLIKLSPKQNVNASGSSNSSTENSNQLRTFQIPGKSGIQYFRVLPASKKPTTISEASTAAAAKLLNAAPTKFNVVRQNSGGKFIITNSPNVDGTASPSKVQKTIVTVPTLRTLTNQESLATTVGEGSSNKNSTPMAVTLLRPKPKISEINTEIKRMTAATFAGGPELAKKVVGSTDGKRYFVMPRAVQQQQNQLQKLNTQTPKVIVKSGTGTAEGAVRSFIICKSSESDNSPVKTLQIKKPFEQHTQQQQIQQNKQFLENKSITSTIDITTSSSKNLTNNNDNIGGSSSSSNNSNNNKFVPIKIKEELLDSDEMNSIGFSDDPFVRGGIRRKHCNCSKSQCLKLYCDCFANGEFCQDCTCKDCFNSLQYEDERLRAIRSCLDRNPSAFKPKITSAADQGDARLHNKGCNCKRSGCLKNYCECFEAKIPCSSNCKCVGCRNIEDRPDLDMDPIDPKILETIANASNATDTIARAVSHQSSGGNFGVYGVKRAFENLSESDTDKKRRRSDDGAETLIGSNQLSDDDEDDTKQVEKRNTNFITQEVIDATIQCMISQADECLKNSLPTHQIEKMVIEELGRCLVEIIDFSIRNTDNSFTQN